MAPLTEPANPAQEPSIIEVLRQRRKNKPKKGVKEKIVFNHTERTMASIEHPFLVRDVDDALLEFGRNPEWDQLLEDDAHNTSVPFYFDPRPTGRPTMSSNVPTNNVLIKVTVPKRTGRRRKKGSDGPWLDAHGKRRLEEEEEGDKVRRLASKKSRQDDDTGGSVVDESVGEPPFKIPGASGLGFGPLFNKQGQGRDNGDDEDDERTPYEKEKQRRRLYDQSQMMKPKKLMRMLQDNIGKYKLEGVGNVVHTHRFRSLADFDIDMSNSRFMNNFLDKVMNGNIKTMREFRMETNPPMEPGGDIIAPPQFTNLALPFQYFYEQNPYVRVHARPDSAGDEDMDDAEADFRLINVTRNKLLNKSFFISHNHVGVPMEPVAHQDEDPELLALVVELHHLLHQRPIWTRRSLFNQLGMDVRSWDLFKRAIQHVAYQFKSGPWHNAVIRFGVDPRTEPQYRKYQTMQFKLQRKGEQPLKRRHRHVADASTGVGGAGDAGSSSPGGVRPGEALLHPTASNPNAHDSDSGDADPKPNRGTKRYYHDGNPNSHLFDGKEYSSSGRVWQVCDITDPLLSRLLREAPVRPTCSTENSGWYHAGAWKKAKNIMRVKMIGIRFKKPVRDEDFDRVIHEYPDRTPPPDQKIPYFLLPNLHLTDEEMMQLQGDNRWRRNLRPGAGQKYIEKDGTVQVMTDKIPGYTTVFKDEEIAAAAAAAAAAGAAGREGGSLFTATEHFTGALGSGAGMLDDPMDVIDPFLHALDTEVDKSDQAQQRQQQQQQQLVQKGQEQAEYSQAQQAHPTTVTAGDSNNAKITMLNQDNVLAELSDYDSFSSDSDVSDSDEAVPRRGLKTLAAAGTGSHFPILEELDAPEQDEEAEPTFGDGYGDPYGDEFDDEQEEEEEEEFYDEDEGEDEDGFMHHRHNHGYKYGYDDDNDGEEEEASDDDDDGIEIVPGGLGSAPSAPAPAVDGGPATMGIAMALANRRREAEARAEERTPDDEEQVEQQLRDEMLGRM